MPTYWVQSKAGVDFGLWHGKSREQAFDNFVRDSGGDLTDWLGNSIVGSVDDWIVDEIDLLASED